MNGFLSFNRIISETATTFAAKTGCRHYYVDANDDGEKLAASLDQSSKVLSDIQSCTRERKNTYCYSARSKDVESAHELGLSYGKYKAFLELQSLNPDITVSDIQNMTMREIKDLTDKLSAKENNNASSDNSGQKQKQNPKHGQKSSKRQSQTQNKKQNQTGNKGNPQGKRQMQNSANGQKSNSNQSRQQHGRQNRQKKK